MAVVDTNSIIPQPLVSEMTPLATYDHSDVRPLSPATLSAIAELTMNGIVALVIDGCINSKKSFSELTSELKKGLELQSTFNPEQFKPDLLEASVANLAELASASCEAEVVLKEIFTEIEKELLTNNPRKLSEASVESLIQLVCAFDKANLLTPELAKAVKDEILFKDADKLHTTDAKQIALLLGVFSKTERIDRAFFEAIEMDLIDNHGRKMYKSDLKDLTSIAVSFRKAEYGDHDLYAKIHALSYFKMKRS